MARPSHITRYVVFTLIGLLVTASFLRPHNTPQSPMGGDAIFASFAPEALKLPVILSAKDRGLYQDIVAAQKKSDWAAADALVAKLSSKLLMGHVLAERYLSRHYTASAAELTKWLEHYSDHPEASGIYTLAVAKSPTLKQDLSPVRKTASLQGYGDDNGLAASSNPDFMRVWRKGLQAWQSGDSHDAAKLFSSLLKDTDDLSPWSISAAAYWSYRSYNASNDKTEALRYLRMAAEDSRSFYGILARKQLGLPLKLDAKPLSLSESDVLEIIGEPAIRRIVALAESNLGELAEREIRALFPQSDENEKLRLLALAHTLNLASVQISMAKQLDNDGRTLDYAKYPVPSWQPKDGFTVDPALVYALARQESGFRPSAVSPGGALGLMQLMPQTASMMKKAYGSPIAQSSNVSEPVMNMTLGQNYVQHLLDNPLVEGNMVYLLAAYNAGPGRLQEWKQRFSQDDPLLFMENIPFAQTRHYVMQVMANYWVYSDLAGSTNRTASALANGQWPSYDKSASPIAARAVMDKAG